jgi:hypothetical protein
MASGQMPGPLDGGGYLRDGGAVAGNPTRDILLVL